MDLVRNTAWKTERGEMQGDARPPLSHGWAPEFYNINTCKDINFFFINNFWFICLKETLFYFLHRRGGDEELSGQTRSQLLDIIQVL